MRSYLEFIAENTRNPKELHALYHRSKSYALEYEANGDKNMAIQFKEIAEKAKAGWKNAGHNRKHGDITNPNLFKKDVSSKEDQDASSARKYAQIRDGIVGNRDKLENSNKKARARAVAYAMDKKRIKRDTLK